MEKKNQNVNKTVGLRKVTIYLSTDILVKNIRALQRN